MSSHHNFELVKSVLSLSHPPFFRIISTLHITCMLTSSKAVLWCVSWHHCAHNTHCSNGTSKNVLNILLCLNEEMKYLFIIQVDLCDFFIIKLEPLECCRPRWPSAVLPNHNKKRCRKDVEFHASLVCTLHPLPLSIYPLSSHVLSFLSSFFLPLFSLTPLITFASDPPFLSYFTSLSHLILIKE